MRANYTHPQTRIAFVGEHDKLNGRETDMFLAMGSRRFDVLNEVGIAAGNRVLKVRPVNGNDGTFYVQEIAVRGHKPLGHGKFAQHQIATLGVKYALIGEVLPTDWQEIVKVGFRIELAERAKVISDARRAIRKMERKAHREVQFA